MRAMQTAATGMEAQTLRIDTIANNLANANTTGFKKSQVDFAELMYVTLRWPGGGSTQDTQAPTGLQVGSGVFPVSTLKVFTEGTIENTAGEFDMAITGLGFFQVEAPNGEEGGALLQGVDDFVGMFLPQTIAGHSGDALTRYIYESLKDFYGGHLDASA